MYRRHVYVDAAKLTSSFIEQKWRNTQQPGARFAPAAFVTGNLDAITLFYYSRQIKLETLYLG